MSDKLKVNDDNTENVVNVVKNDVHPVIKNNNKTPVSSDTVFTLKRWNLVAMWSWDVECEVCAICRTPLMGKFLIRTVL